MDVRPTTPTTSDDASPRIVGEASTARQEGRRAAHAGPTRPGWRRLPSTDRLAHALRTHEVASGTPEHADALYTWAARAALAEARAAISQGGAAPDEATLLARASGLLSDRTRLALRPVINATGVVLNTNLGRSPLSEAAIASVVAVARGYSTLEVDLAAGERGSRQTHLRALLREVIGAEDALVVNNNAAAVLVVLSALASGGDVILSRGELVEIGGGFRIPDVMRQSGARLVEVGTTNRTRLADYRAAITPQTALLLAVHPSNFRIVGFTETVPLADLAVLAHEHNLPLMHDLGSGALVATEAWGMAHEPTPAESLAAGCDVVCFSGDKLLGGPQAGIIVGRASILQSIARHPLMRALRVDKMTLAALEATLRAYRDGTADQTLPTLRMLSRPLADLRAQATAWAAALRASGIPARVIDGADAAGGGSLPGETLPTALCAIGPLPGTDADHQTGNARHASLDDVAELARRLRLGDPPVLARVLRDQLLLDPRTVAPDQDETLLASVRSAVWSTH